MSRSRHKTSTLKFFLSIKRYFMLIKNLNVVDEMKNFNGMVDFNERAAGFMTGHIARYQFVRTCVCRESCRRIFTIRC
jgi:hypothetical protein